MRVALSPFAIYIFLAQVGAIQNDLGAFLSYLVAAAAFTIFAVANLPTHAALARYV
jgi:cell division protein FtsW (lipid II flippase)